MRATERSMLVDVLIWHYRRGSGCGCGWGQGQVEHLGKSWPEHVVQVFEESVAASLTVAVTWQVVSDEIILYQGEDEEAARRIFDNLRLQSAGNSPTLYRAAEWEAVEHG